MKTFGRRTISVVLSVIMVLSCFASMTFSVEADTLIGDYWCVGLSDGTISITQYMGTDTDVTIPAEINGKKVVQLGTWAFLNCTSIKSITIPDTVTKIGTGAFARCTGLTSIEIPDSVTDLRASSFDGCTNLKEIIVSEENANYKSVDGVLFNKDMTAVAVYPQGKEGVYSIPDGITSINYNAFLGCEKLTGVIIPDSVTKICDSAFERCVGLTSIALPDSLTEIGNYSFYECNSIASLTIPASVTEIGVCPFFGIKEIDVSENGNFKTVDGVLFNKDGTKLIEYFSDGEGEYVIPDGVTEIGDYAFVQQDGLTGITISDSVTEIGIFSFGNCNGLKNVTIPGNVEYIYDYAFYDCKELEKLTIEDGVVRTGICAFYGCDKLTGATILSPDVSMGFGFGYSDFTEDGKIDGFTFYGYSDSTAQTYASEHELNFVAIDLCEHTETQIENAKDASCSEKGYTGDIICVNCKTVLEKGEEIPILNHSFVNYVSDNNASCTKDGTKTAKCEYCDKTDTIADANSAKGHTDSDSDGICDICGEVISEVKNCKCICHKSGIAGFFYKIFRFFWRLFGINKTCDCGKLHY